jgi:signal transduction histidine kinase
VPDARAIRRFLAQPRADLALAVGLAVASMFELFVTPGMTGSPLAVVEIVLVCAPLVVLRTHPVAAAWAVAVVVVASPSFNGRFPVFAGDLVIVALAYACGAHASLRQGGSAVLALIVALQVRMGFSEFPNVEIAFATVGPLWVGYQVRLRTQLVTRLADRTRELKDEEDAFARLAVRRERARIAHELHDIVAHHLAVIVVQAGAGRVARHAPNARTAERFSTIRQSGAQALAEMARLVDILHADDSGDRGALGTLRLLVDQAQASGLDVHVTSLPSDLPLPPEIGEHAYRIVREGLTNAIKHAPGSDVHVRLALHHNDLEIDVHDGGSSNAGRLAHTGSGLGLIGMRERIESIGGTVDAGPERDGGWRLHAVLPTTARS